MLTRQRFRSHAVDDKGKKGMYTFLADEIFTFVIISRIDLSWECHPVVWVNASFGKNSNLAAKGLVLLFVLVQTILSHLWPNMANTICSKMR